MRAQDVEQFARHRGREADDASRRAASPISRACPACRRRLRIRATARSGRGTAFPRRASHPRARRAGRRRAGCAARGASPASRGARRLRQESIEPRGRLDVRSLEPALARARHAADQDIELVGRGPRPSPSRRRQHPRIVLARDLSHALIGGARESSPRHRRRCPRRGRWRCPNRPRSNRRSCVLGSLRGVPVRADHAGHVREGARRPVRRRAAAPDRPGPAWSRAPSATA